MSEKKVMVCRRCGANENRIHGFCSMECQTAWDYEEDIRELESFIKRLITAGDNLDCVISVISTTIPYGDPYLEQSEWTALIHGWKEREE